MRNSVFFGRIVGSGLRREICLDQFVFHQMAWAILSLAKWVFGIPPMAENLTPKQGLVSM